MLFCGRVFIIPQQGELSFGGRTEWCQRKCCQESWTGKLSFIIKFQTINFAWASLICIRQGVKSALHKTAMRFS